MHQQQARLLPSGQSTNAADEFHFDAVMLNRLAIFEAQHHLHD